MSTDLTGEVPEQWPGQSTYRERATERVVGSQLV